jgi:opacity protein-like surface antigen
MQRITMKKLLVASAAALLLGTFAGSTGALADSYISVLGGPTWAPDLNVGGTTNKMDTGFNIGARYGYYLDSWGLPNVSLEADGLFNQSTFAANNAGRIQSSSYMANAVYHLPLESSPFSLYGGAGLGAVQTNIDDNAGHHGGSTVLGWQAIGGVDWRLNDMTGLFAEYRYQNAHDVNAGGFTNVGNTSNSLSVGVKWHL